MAKVMNFEDQEPLKFKPNFTKKVPGTRADLGLLPNWFFPKNEFFLYTADPATIQEIQSKEDIFHSRTSGMVFDTTTPLSLLALRSEGPHSAWAFHRRLVAPLFSDKFLESYSEQVSQKADLLRYVLNERIKYAKGAQAECDLQLALKLITLDVSGSIGFALIPVLS